MRRKKKSISFLILRIYKRLDKDTCVCIKIPLSQLDLLEHEMKNLDDELGNQRLKINQIDHEYKKYINMLHDYNEIKDIAQEFIGMLAELQQCSIQKLHQELDLPVEKK